nr:ATP-binding protein [Streptomyces griseoruber]
MARPTTAVTTHVTPTLKDLQRLLHHCDVISINGPSYQLKNRLTAIDRDTDAA